MKKPKEVFPDRNWIRIALAIILAAAVTANIFITSFKSVAYNLDFYQSEFLKRNIEFTANSYLNTTKKILQYYSNGIDNDLIDEDTFREREKIHLLEVKQLFGKLNAIHAVSVIVIVLAFATMLFLEGGHAWRGIGLSMLYSGSAIIAITAIVFLAMINFGAFFTDFHLTVFQTDTWLLDPDDKLIQMYPQEFFMEAARKIFVTAIIAGSILLAIGISIERHFRDKKAKV